MRTGLTQISQTMLDINSLMKDKDGLNSKLQDFMEAVRRLTGAAAAPVVIDCNTNLGDCCCGCVGEV